MAISRVHASGKASRTRNSCLVLISACLLLSMVLANCRAGGEQGSVSTPANTPVLLFDGAGTSPGDVAALKKILASEHLVYSTASSNQLNEMSESRISEYRLLIVPGGNFEVIGNRLTPAATAIIRTAVENGLNYLGICAGAFFAGNSPYNGLNLTSGARFRFYAAEARGIRKTAVSITSAEGQALDQYWEDGPQLTGWGAVVARYPDATPAIVEGTAGKGFMILTGVHPEAPADWRHGLIFKTPADEDNAWAATLIHAALKREWLAHY